MVFGSVSSPNFDPHRHAAGPWRQARQAHLGREGRRDFDEPPGGGDGPEERDLLARCCQKLFWDWSAEYKAAALAVPDDTALSQRRARTVHHDRI